jgi:nitroreductase
VDVLDAIAARRSTGRLAEPAPSDEELVRMVEAAVAAPDHGTLRPWRFIVLRDDAKTAFGAVLAEAYERRCAGDGSPVVPAKLEKERTKLGRAPVVVVVAAVPQEGKIPEVEQVAAVAAATENLLLAATALGYGSMWRTGDPCYDDHVKAALGLDASAHLVGFVYLGTAASPARETEVPRTVDGVLTTWVPA